MLHSLLCRKEVETHTPRIRNRRATVETKRTWLRTARVLLQAEMFFPYSLWMRVGSRQAMSGICDALGL